MLIFSGWWTIAALLATALVGSLLESITGSRQVGYVLAGAALTAGAWWLHQRDPDRPETLFWIPLRWWGPIVAVGALAGL